MASRRTASGTAIMPVPAITRCSYSTSSVIWNAVRYVPATCTVPMAGMVCSSRLLRATRARSHASISGRTRPLQCPRSTSSWKPGAHGQSAVATGSCGPVSAHPDQRQAHALFCESQHRALPSLRKHALHPEMELHPETAEVRGIAAGDWVAIETPKGSVRARARLNPSLDARAVCGQHGCMHACKRVGAPAYNPFEPDGANLNLVIGGDARDPISGTAPHRAYLCEVRRLG